MLSGGVYHSTHMVDPAVLSIRRHEARRKATHICYRLAFVHVSPGYDAGCDTFVIFSVLY